MRPNNSPTPTSGPPEINKKVRSRAVSMPLDANNVKLVTSTDPRRRRHINRLQIFQFFSLQFILIFECMHAHTQKNKSQQPKLNDAIQTQQPQHKKK